MIEENVLGFDADLINDEWASGIDLNRLATRRGKKTAYIRWS
jgi:hypothetical protein